MISAIVAVNEDWGIGYNNDLLEHIPADLKNFKELTTGNTIIMGRKTWDSLPKKPLPNRKHIVITNDTPDFKDDVVFTSMRVADYLMRLTSGYSEVFIIGGASIYKQLLPYCNRVYVTKIYKKHENVDTYFPNLDETDDWTTTPIAEPENYKDFSYQFWRYDRKS